VARQPDGPAPPPTVQRLAIRYAKRGRLRFTSHRDFARAFERALRRAELPMAYSAGFSPHPKVSYVGAAPTGVASEAEYLEIGLTEPRDPGEVARALDAALPPGLDVVQVVETATKGLPDRIDASRWLIELPEVEAAAAEAAVERFLALETAPVDRLVKDGKRTVDARAAVVGMAIADSRPSRPADPQLRGETDTSGVCAIIDMVVRHRTPAVRPDDVLTALRQAAALSTPVTPQVTRLSQGLLGEVLPAPGELPSLSDPLAPDAVATGLPPA
jgi:radical SAM-linked protein